MLVFILIEFSEIEGEQVNYCQNDQGRYRVNITIGTFRVTIRNINPLVILDEDFNPLIWTLFLVQAEHH